MKNPQRESVARKPSPLDRSQLLERCLGNAALAERVVARFQEQFAAELVRLEAHLRDGDHAALTSVSHRLKGTCANVAAEGLREIAARLEEAARAGRTAEARAAFDELRAEWTQFNAADW
ncbi:MAG: Hpt domain-containing protein [Planctomycetaceae bacterium]